MGKSCFVLSIKKIETKIDEFSGRIGSTTLVLLKKWEFIELIDANIEGSFTLLAPLKMKFLITILIQI